MIYLVIKGGLGNQLYQAGFGLLVEQLTGQPVRFLTHGFKNYSYGFNYELNDSFPQLKGREVAMDEVPANTPVICEHDAQYNLLMTLEQILAAARSHDNLLMDGYWSDERLWDGHVDFYRQVLTPRPDNPVVAELGVKLQSTPCIGIHVRRYDYGHLGLARMDYYRNALAQIRRERGNLPALVFTDEYNVCCHEFQGIPGVEVVKGERHLPVRDFFALTQCRHFIASNSTFSGLAAILGERDDSIVYYPYPICVFHNNTLIESREKRWRIVEDAVQKP